MRWPQQNPGDPSTPRTGPSLHAPPLFSPTCPGSAFPAAASSAVVSEHPCVVLDEWWLARVEGQGRKIAVAGFFQRNQTVLDFTAAPIAKCHSPYVLQTENGTVVLISHSLNIKRTLENGFTIEACEKFSLGFPQWWQNWNVLYPKMLSSQTGSQLSSSGTSKSHEDSSRFYMEMFQTGKCLDSLINNALNKAKAFSSNGDAFPDSSHLPNGAPRFEEYGCDDDTPTIEKSAASNHDSNKVENMEIDLIRAIISKEGTHDGIDSNIASASMMECANDEGDVGIFNASRLNNGCQKTHAALLKRRGRLKKPQRVALSESVPGEGTATLAYSDVQSSEKGKKPVGTSRKQRSTFGKLQRATRSSNIISPIPYGNLSPLTCGWPKSFTMSTPESLKLKNTRSGRVVVPALVPGCQNIVYAPDGSISAIIGLNSPPPLKGSTSKNYARKKKRTN